MIAAGVADKLLKQLFWIAESGLTREQDVAASALRDANQVHVDERVVNEITEPQKFRLRRLEDSALVVTHGGDVLDAKHLRFEDGRSARDLRIKRVARVGTPRVVVEI